MVLILPLPPSFLPSFIHTTKSKWNEPTLCALCCREVFKLFTSSRSTDDILSLCQTKMKTIWLCNHQQLLLLLSTFVNLLLLLERFNGDDEETTRNNKPIKKVPLHHFVSYLNHWSRRRRRRRRESSSLPLITRPSTIQQHPETRLNLK